MTQAPGASTGGYRIDAQDVPGLDAYLQKRGWLLPGESVVAVTRAGQGNMNLTLRVATQGRSLIVKQGRPWVEKYPHIPAPPDRTVVEGRFYQLVQQTPVLAERMPRLYGLDAQARVLVLADLGDAADLSTLYSGAEVSDSALAELVSYLGDLHQVAVPAADRELLGNAAMRALNHEHIFRLPLDPDNGLHLDAITDGLAALARQLGADPVYVRRVRELGQQYQATNQGSLCHGDFFPGSWLATTAGVRIIDPEFCFLGPPEFDLGVMLAHLYLGVQSPSKIAAILPSYEQYRRIDHSLARALAGVEIMRRLLGVAQLPLTADLGAKRRLLELSHDLVVH